ncbi:MAG: hypothetical protein ACOYIM_00135 [Bacilli bacterium]|jgi:4-hydroxybenzoate polyprenyltransferase
MKKQTLKFSLGVIIILAVFTIVLTFLELCHGGIGEVEFFYFLTVLLAIILFSIHIITDKKTDENEKDK